MVQKIKFKLYKLFGTIVPNLKRYYSNVYHVFDVDFE